MGDKGSWKSGNLGRCEEGSFGRQEELEKRELERDKRGLGKVAASWKGALADMGNSHSERERERERERELLSCMQHTRQVGCKLLGGR